MKDQENKKTLKISRQRYFQMLLTLGSLGPKLNLWTEDTTSLIDLLVTSKFLSQELLEKTLYHLRIEDRGRLMSIKNFDGQLERDSRGMLYWNVYLQTSTLRTLKNICFKLTFFIVVVPHAD